MITVQWLWSKYIYISFVLCPPSSVSTLLLVLGPLGRATAAPVPVAFIVPLFPMFDPGLAVLVVPVSGARS